MSTHRFDKADNRVFWKGNRATYHGTKTARFLVSWTADVLGRNVLDAGAGDGSLVRSIRAAGATVLGVDLAPKSDDIEEGDLTELRFKDGEFDTVYCSEVIEHVSPEMTQTILGELVRVLSTGGHLVLTTPFREDLESSLVTCPGCELSFHRWGHQQTFCEEDFAELAKRLGLQVISIAPVRFSRIKRWTFMGPGFLRSSIGRKLVRGIPNAPNRTLVLVAKKG
ncbi:MAG: class I SAM-dependent methyltransferase [bacterium]|nr:class I SAM-dependent methyltransferase [bacterium]